MMPHRRRALWRRASASHPLITAEYGRQHVGLIQSARQQLFQMALSKRLLLRPDQNKRWLQIVATAREANARRELYLLQKIPKLQTFYAVTRKAHTGEISEKYTYSDNSTQTLMSSYISHTPSETREETLGLGIPSSMRGGEGAGDDDNTTSPVPAQRRQLTLKEFFYRGSHGRHRPHVQTR